MNINTSNPTKVRLLYALSFLDLFACSLVIPLLAPHLRSLGASHFTIGVLSSLYAGLQLVSGPAIGSWSDIRGHRFILQLTLVICSFLYFLMGAVTTIPVLMIIRIGLGMLKHTQALCRTLLADIVPSEDQLTTQSRLVSFGAVGFIIGPAIGGHLAETEDGFFYVCVIVMFFFWGNYAIVSLFFCEPVDKIQKGTQSIDTPRQTARREEQQNGFHRNHSSVIKSSTNRIYLDFTRVVKNLSEVNWSVYWDIFALKFILGFSHAVHFQNFTLTLKEMYDVSPKWIGYTISLQGLVSACTGFTTQWISGFYNEDENNVRKTLHGFAILTLSFILLSMAPNLTFVVLFLAPLSAAGSLLRITTSEMVLQRTAPNQRGSLIGSGHSMSSIARLLAPLFSGIAFDMFGFYGLAVLKITVAGAGVVLTNILYVWHKQEKKTL